jgi:hypothetical protein
MGKSLEQFEAETQGKSMLTGPNGEPGQCVGYMRLYIDQVLDLPQPSGKPAAKDQYLQYDSDPNLNSNFKKLGPQDALVPGDIVFWNAKPNNRWGHVAICTSFSDKGQPFSVVEQNVNPKLGVGERASVQRDGYFLGAFRPYDGVPGQKITRKALNILKNAGSSILGKFKKAVLGENMIDEFIDYSENYVSLRERQQNDRLNGQLVAAGRDAGIKASTLLFECIPYIHESNLNQLYDDIQKLQHYEKRLTEAGQWNGWTPPEQAETPPVAQPSQEETFSPVEEQQSHGRKKTKLKNEVLAKLKDYLQSKPVPDKRQVARVKQQILALLGEVTPAAAPAQPTAEQQVATPQAAEQQAAQPRAALDPITNQRNLVSTIQKSVPYGFFGGNNDKLKNKVTEIILNEYRNGNKSAEGLIQAVQKGIGRTGFGVQNDLFNTLRMNLNKAAAAGKIQLTESRYNRR